eukprot:m.249301 g.249301  ORF g.249301 m.249301 type:complete len:843 (+) comp17165_c1_seq4:528-3056(+)
MRVAPRFPGGTVFVVIALAAALLLLATMRGSQPVNDTPRNQLQQEDGQQRPNNEFLDRNTNQARSDHNNRGNNLNNNKQPTQDAADRTPKDSGGKMMNRNKKTRPRLVVHLFAYNRPSGFRTLWSQLIRAKPASRLPVRIVIHVDYDPLQSDEWKEQVDIASALTGVHTIHGPVTTVFAASPKGLRATMLEAWAPVEGEYAMFLEDDIEVSEMLFVYAEAFVQRYGESAERDASVMGYKLYNQKWDEVNQRYERPINNGHMPFKIQEPCSWGTVFVAEPYARYLRWYVDHSNIDPFIPHAWSNTWDAERSAKKYLQRFMWEEGLFLISINLPNHLSLTTPHVEAGTNIKQKWLPYLKERLEVPLVTEKEESALHGLDTIFKGPEPSAMMILNTSHEVVKEIHLPSVNERQLLSSSRLPSGSVLDPLHHQGARDRVIAKAKQRLLEEFEQWPLRARRAGQISPAEDAALREMLLTSHKQSRGLPLPRSYVDKITTSYTLYALGAMLLSPLGQLSLLVETEYGLTNRLRAYGSAKAIADATARQLVVLWVPNAHCYASLEHLFTLPKSVIVVEDELLREAVALVGMDVYDLMQPEQKGARVDGSKNTHIYVRSAFRINSRHPYGDTDALHVRSLVLQPSDGVRGVLNEYYDDLAREGLDAPESAHRSFVGVHIRMLANMTADTPGLTAEEALRMELAVAFRVSCHYRFFQERMLTLPTTTKFFISTDSPESFDVLKTVPGLSSRVFRLDSQHCTQRTVECMRYAAADLYLLSTTARLFTSKWSAFSETAARVGGMPTEDGCDQPPGGWKLGGDHATMTSQIINYLKSQNYADVARVQAALERFM